MSPWVVMGAVVVAALLVMALVLYVDARGRARRSDEEFERFFRGGR